MSGKKTKIHSAPQNDAMKKTIRDNRTQLLHRHAASALLALICLLISCKGDNSSVPVEKWQIAYIEDPSFENIIKNALWEPVDITSRIKLPYLKRERKYFYTWLRGDFYIAGDPSKYYGITLGRIYHTDRVLINTTPVGSCLPDEIRNIAHPRHYIIPAGALVKGANTVYIHLGIYGIFPGLLPDAIKIEQRKDFSNSTFLYSILFEKIPLIMIFIFIAFIFKFIKDYILKTDGREAIFVTISLCTHIIVNTALFSSFIPLSLSLIAGLLCAQVPIHILSILLYFQALYGKMLSRLNLIVIPFLILSSLFLLAGRNLPFYRYMVYALLIIICLGAAALFLFLNIKSNKIKPDKYRFYYINYIIIHITALAILELMVYIPFLNFFKRIAKYSGLAELYSFPLIILISTYYFTRKEIIRRKRRRSVYNKLLAKVEQRKKISITSTSEDKIHEIIDFLKAHYTSDISREGLAEAVDISPNYFSRLFHEYTGMKINEYIYKLRIDDAIGQLKNSPDKTVTEIAFSVGFESLSTFSRIFKSQTGITPGDVRAAG